jgi:phosphoglycerol transferase MdoB-like AlkP superfamily enzyme
MRTRHSLKPKNKHLFSSHFSYFCRRPALISFMKQNFHRSIFLLKLFGICLVFLLTQRLIFYFAMREMFTESSLGELVNAFFVGEIADASVTVYFLLPFWLTLIFFNTEYKIVKRSALFFLAIGITLITLLNLSDIGYFPITKKRMGAEILSMLDEIPALLSSYLKDYWYLFILLLLYIYFGFKVIKIQIEKFKDAKPPMNFRTANMILMLFLFFTAMRGGYFKRPFSPFDIPSFVDPKLQWLASNTPFQLLHTFGNENLPTENYFTEEEAEKLIGFNKNYGKGVFNNKNVLIIILESFCSERIGFYNPQVKNYTPFMDSLLGVSRTYQYGMANGRMTIDALPSVLSGIPSMMEKNYCYSPYNNNSVKGLSGLLAKNGYTSAFYYGGLKNTFGFENYIKLNFSKNYVSQEDFDGKYENSGWGVDDHIYLPFVAKKLNALPKPFVASLLTLSLHHPFPIPEPYKTSLDSIKDPVKKSMRYTDIALQQFFSEIKKQDWYRNSIIALCADHTSGGFGIFEGNEANAFAIPVVFHVPGDSTFNQPQNTSASQVDMYPTILDYLGYPEDFGSLGRSALRENLPTIQYAGNGIYQLFEYPYFLEFDNNNKALTKFRSLDERRIMNERINDKSVENEKLRLEKLMKAYIQVFSTRVNGNSL